MLTAFIKCTHDDVVRADFTHQGNKRVEDGVFKYEKLALQYSEGSGSFLLDVLDEKLLLYDYHTGYLEQFDKEGRYSRRLLFPGRGPEQIDDFWIFGRVSREENIVLGCTFNYMLFDDNWKKKGSWKKFQNFKQSIPIVMNSEIFEEPEIYTVDYLNELQKPAVTTEGLLILPVTIRKKRLNGYRSETNADLYYKYARSLSLVDIQSGELKMVFANKPPIYNEVKYLAYLDACFYTTSKNCIYVGHLADSCVYVYTHRGGPMYKFGFSGKDMRIPKPLGSMDEFEEHSDFYQKTEPSYWSLYYDEERSLLFRSYRKSETKGGLQVYREDDLILDQEVPFPFFVRGKIGNNYYADGFRQDEEEKSIVAYYRFTL